MKYFSFLCLYVILFFIGAASSNAALFVDEKQLHKIAFGKDWLKLLHYKKRLNGAYYSLVDGEHFFLHPQGKNNPLEELRATIAAFNTPNLQVGFIKQDPQCAFVERLNTLDKFGLIERHGVRCKDFEEWKEGVKGDSISLIFSSYFPNNPSSIFGHTFIRFNKGANEASEKMDLLDYTASYAAGVPEDVDPFTYAFKGVFGGFYGFFQFAPYYLKVNEYVSSESRDLFEYELNISKEGVDRIINHLWELYSSTYFYYYFLDENCSYILAQVLEVGMPEWDLDSSKFYYLPSLQIKKIINVPGAIKKRKVRISLKKKFQHYLGQLEGHEKGELKELLRQQKIGHYSNLRVIDTLIEYLNYFKHKNKFKQSEKEKEFYRDVLLARAKLGHNDKLDAFDDSETLYNAPEYSHDSSSMQLSYGVRNEQSFGSLSYKAGYQDLLGSARGLEANSAFDFLEMKIRYDKENHLLLEKIGFLNIDSYVPFSYFNRQLSWTFGSNIQTIRNQNSNISRHWTNYALGGVSLGQRYLVALMGGLFFNSSPHYDKAYQLGPRFELNFLLCFSQDFRMYIENSVEYDVKFKMNKNYLFRSNLAYSYSLSQNVELRMKHELIYTSLDRHVETYENQFSFVKYF